jgi:uncharacterized protein Yka (UPF0111/DUF47 family)
MTTIVEVQESKLECLKEYVEKVIKYGEKVLHCIKELEEDEESEHRHSRYY